MTACDRCGRRIRRIYPVDTRKPLSLAGELRQPVSRGVLYALGAPEPPWGEHSDDDRFESWCEECVRLATTEEAAQ